MVMEGLSKQELLAGKLVQEIAKNGEQVPENFFHKNGFPEAIDDPNLWKDNLLIDMSLLLSSSSTSELAKLRSAFSQWGCCQIINHGIEISFLEALNELCKQFFELPLEEKLKCSAEGEIIEGYGSDVLYSGNQIYNWNDRLFLTMYPKEKFKLQCWPQKPKNFREMVNEYSKKLTEVNQILCKAMSRALDIDENCLNFGKKGPSKSRFTLYPRCPCPERVLGTKAHTDGTIITYLLPDSEVEGLDIMKDEQWYKVSVIPGAIFINMGDIGEVITNGVFKSAKHRVGIDSVKDRISVAVFFLPEDDDLIEPVREVVSAYPPQVYRKFNISEYWVKFLDTFSQGPNYKALDAFRV